MLIKIRATARGIKPTQAPSALPKAATLVTPRGAEKEHKYRVAVEHGFSLKFFIFCQRILRPAEDGLFEVVCDENRRAVETICAGIYTPLEC